MYIPSVHDQFNDSYLIKRQVWSYRLTESIVPSYGRRKRIYTIILLPVCDVRKHETDVSPVEDSQVTSTNINIIKY